MYYIVFDLEWNMAGFRNRVAEHVKKAMPFEIIEIGAIKLDGELREVDRFSIWIKPVVYTILDKHVAAVTKRFPESLEQGVSFQEGVERFYRWAAEAPSSNGSGPRPLPGMPEDVVQQAEAAKYIFATWSNSDSGPLRDNMRYHGMDARLPARVLDVQRLFAAVANEGTSQQRSLAYALEFLEIEQNDDLHLSLHDAIYTSKILQSLRQRMRAVLADPPVDDQPDWFMRMEKLPGYQLADWLWAYSYDPNLIYQLREVLDASPSLEEALEQAKSRALICPDCGDELIEKSSWKQGKSSKVAKSWTIRLQCPQHGAISGQLRVRRDKNGVWHGRLQQRIERPYEL